MQPVQGNQAQAGDQVACQGVEASAREVLRLGAVSFLNVQPLIWAFETGHLPKENSPWGKVEIGSAVPRKLAGQLRSGQTDVAIVPVFEYLRHPHYTIIPGAAIATRGPVGSVMLFSDVALEKVKLVRLDPSSLTSVHLLKVLLLERGQAVEYRELPQEGEGEQVPLEPDEARLLIGDPAIAACGRYRYTYDLGDVWHARTGLPFVFAAWLACPSVSHLPLGEMLLCARKYGEQHLETVANEVASRFGVTPEFALFYFRHNLCYELGEAEVAGWQEFARLCHKHGFITSVPEFRFHQG